MIVRGDDSAGATFSACEAYRYSLWRRWAKGPVVTFILLNPSTADHESNDPTVKRCCNRARHAGYGGIIVCNLFAFRATNPRELTRVIDDPVGAENDSSIVRAAKSAELVVCGWGNHGLLQNRSKQVTTLLDHADIAMYALGVTNKGQPRHPLYVGYSALPRRWTPDQ